MNMPKSLLSVAAGAFSLLSTVSMAAPTEVSCHIYYYHHGKEPRAGTNGPEKTERLDVNSLQFDVSDATHTFTVFLGNTKTDAIRLTARHKKTGVEIAGFHGDIDWDGVPQLWVAIPERKIAGDTVNRVGLNCIKN